jgi:hypothetical protein
VIICVAQGHSIGSAVTAISWWVQATAEERQDAFDGCLQCAELCRHYTGYYSAMHVGAISPFTGNYINTAFSDLLA